MPLFEQGISASAENAAFRLWSNADRMKQTAKVSSAAAFDNIGLNVKLREKGKPPQAAATIATALFQLRSLTYGLFGSGFAVGGNLFASTHARTEPLNKVQEPARRLATIVQTRNLALGRYIEKSFQANGACQSMNSRDFDALVRRRQDEMRQKQHELVIAAESRRKNLERQIGSARQAASSSRSLLTRSLVGIAEDAAYTQGTITAFERFNGSTNHQSSNLAKKTLITRVKQFLRF